MVFNEKEFNGKNVEETDFKKTAESLTTEPQILQNTETITVQKMIMKMTLYNSINDIFAMQNSRE